MEDNLANEELKRENELISVHHEMQVSKIW